MQGVGERGLAGAVGAHDRVDLALADGQVDALEDLVLGVGDRRDVEAADDEVLVGGGLVGHGWVDAPCRMASGWMGVSAWTMGGTRSARVIESRAPVMASRTRTHRTLTVQRALRSHRTRVLGIVGRAEHRGDRALEGSQDLAHPDRLGRARELVAAVGAAGRDDEAGLAQADDELLEVGPREVLLGGDPGQRGGAGPGVARRAGP